MINNVVLVGRLTKDVELRKTNSNTSVCSFTLACNRPYQSNNNNAQTADFINCIAWRQSAEFLSRYASKGSIVAVTGRITTRSYEGQNGRVYITEVTCDSVQLVGKNTNASGSMNVNDNHNKETFTPSSYQNNEPTFEDSLDDDFSSNPSFDISSDDLPFY